MRVLTTCDGELAAPFGPLCDREICGNDCGTTLAGLESAHPTDTVTERDDLTFEHLIASCSGYLQRTGWTDENNEIAYLMAESATEAAAQHPAGTRLHPRFDHETERWTYTPESDITKTHFARFVAPLRKPKSAAEQRI